LSISVSSEWMSSRILNSYSYAVAGDLGVRTINQAISTAGRASAAEIDLLNGCLGSTASQPNHLSFGNQKRLCRDPVKRAVFWPNSNAAPVYLPRLSDEFSPGSRRRSHHVRCAGRRQRDSSVSHESGRRHYGGFYRCKRRALSVPDAVSHSGTARTALTRARWTHGRK